MGNRDSCPVDFSHVIVIGGGYGGLDLALRLDKFCKVTLIDPKEYFHHNIAALRCTVEPSFVKKTLVPYDRLFKHGTFIQARVNSINISLKNVHLDNNEELSYDFVVFACGSSVPFPGKVKIGTSYDDAVKSYTELAEQVEKSDRICIIGGGPVGVELAGEIAVEFPTKKVTVVHAHEQLIDSRLSAKFQRKLQEEMKNRGIDIVLDEKVDMSELDPDSSVISGVTSLKTDKGTSLEADLVFKCTGAWVNTAAFRSKFSDKMEPTGRFKVNCHLQVEEMEDIFAMGDCCNTEELKLAYVAGKHAEIIAHNVKSLMNGKKLKTYTTSPAVMIVTLGRNGGVGQLPNGMVIGNFLTRRLKSSKLMVDRFWKLAGKKPPSS